MSRVKFSTAVAVAVSLLLIAPGSVFAQKAAASKDAAVTPSLAEAHVQMRNAVAKAHAEKKGVLIKFSASWCGPCIGFDRFLFDTTGVGAIMQKYFVIVPLIALENPPKDVLNTPGAEKLAAEMSGGGALASTGIPYFFMLNGDGVKTGDSNNMPDKTNIGQPVSKVEVESFDRLLQVTAPLMTAAERARIKQFLDRDARRS